MSLLINDEQLYNLCQAYRHAPIIDQLEVLDKYQDIVNFVQSIVEERDEYALLLFQPCGNTHHDANKCPYCKDNLNGKS